MKIMKNIRTKAAIAATVLGTGMGAFLMPAAQVYASDGGGAIYVDIPEGWQNQARTLAVKAEGYSIYDQDGKEIPIKAMKVDVAFDEGVYTDVTSSMMVTVDHNCTLKLKAIYEDGNVVANEINITNFDLELPTIKATVEGEVLYLEATDAISGVADISVNGMAFKELEEGKMCANIKDLQTTDEYISIHSDDNAGNASKEYKIKNPYFVGDIESGQEDKSLGNPDSVEPTDPTKARGIVTDDFVTQGREFFTVDASGKTFYLIVDRTQNQENVYLLTEAGVNDLLNFTDYNGVDVQNGDVPMYEIPSNGNRNTEQVLQEPEEIPEEETEPKEEEKPKSNSTTMFIIVVLICGIGVGYYFFKNKKRKEDLAEAEEMDAFDVPDGTELPEGDIEYVEGDVDTPGNEQDNTDDDDQADEEDRPDNTEYADDMDDPDIVYLDEEMLAGADIMPGDLHEEKADSEAERARLLTYFGNKIN